MWIFQSTLSSEEIYQVVKNSTEQPIQNIPLCVKGPKVEKCFTFLFTPITSEVQAIVDKVSCCVYIVEMKIRTQNDPVIPESSVMGFADSTSMDDFMSKNPNTTQGAYLFSISGDTCRHLFCIISHSALGTKKYNYTLQVNLTDQTSFGISISHQKRIQLPMAYAADKAIRKFPNSFIFYVSVSIVSPGIELNISYIEFTHPEVVSLNRNLDDVSC